MRKWKQKQGVPGRRRAQVVGTVLMGARVAVALRKRIERVADRDGVSMTAVVLSALERYVAEQESEQ